MIELGHVGLGVSDMEKSLEFYRDFMGMEILMDLDIRDERIGRVLGVPGAQCRIVHLVKGKTMLELFQYFNPEGQNKARAMQQYDKGLIHLGFEVDNFHELVAKLKEMDVEFLGEAVEFRPDVWVIYFRGPDGEVCELRQQPPKERS